ncbi:MAG TPA: hypothetical protein VGR19_03645 [Allosphingosinicella sp.]|nr:hypothetical protein [Allosphingosinicella sp.]
MLPLRAAACLLPLLLAAQPAGSQIEFAAPIIPGMNMQSARYGNEHWQTFNFLSPKRHSAAPVVIRIEGVPYEGPSEQPSLGFLPSFLYDNDIAYVTVRARPRRKGTAAEQAEDLARAIGEIARNPAKYRLDPHRIALIGAGLEAQPALLLATDPTYLAKAQVPFESVRIAVSMDGEPFDIPKWMAAGGRYRADKYRELFGSDVAGQLRLSPARQVAPPNAPRFLFLVTKGREHLHPQAHEMASALARHGAAAEVLPMLRNEPDVMATYIGAPQHQHTPRLLAVLKQAFGAT